MKENIKNEIEKSYDLIEKANDKILNIWVHDVLFTWQWWAGLLLSILPWVLWIIFRKKESTFRLLCAGFFVILVSCWLDCLGIALGTWHYYAEVVPFIPAYIPWDYSLLPVLTMFFLQYKPKMNPYIKSVIFAGLIAFIGEPVIKWLEFYDPEQWKHIYSFPIFITIYLIAHYISTRKSFGKI